MDTFLSQEIALKYRSVLLLKNCIEYSSAHCKHSANFCVCKFRIIFHEPEDIKIRSPITPYLIQ